MWLENGLNTKQIFAHFCLLVALFFTFDLYLSRSVALVFLGVVFSYFLWVMHQILVKGFYVLLVTRKIGQITHQVRNRFFPLNLKKSYREIALIQSSSISSRSPIFSSEKNNELYSLEIIKDLTSSLSLKKILILGGAGCSFATYFANQKPTEKIDVIENDLIMIKWANQYFLRKDKKINLIYGDGCNYTKYCMGIYDLVIIDMFTSSILETGVIKKTFIKKIKKSIGEDGFFILNVSSDTQISSVIKKWQKYFDLYVYLSYKNFIISNIKFNSFKHESPHRLILEIPQLVGKPS